MKRLSIRLLRILAMKKRMQKLKLPIRLLAVSLLSISGLSPIIRNGLAYNIFRLKVMFFFIMQVSIDHLLQFENKKEEVKERKKWW